MKKFLMFMLVAIMAVSMVGCAQTPEETAEPVAPESKVYNVVNLVNGNLGDKSFFDAAESGLKKLADAGRITYKSIEMGSYDPREPQAFETGIQSGDDPLMGHYFEKLKLQQDDPATVARVAMIRTREWKLVIRSAGKEELYDLKNDPQELSNLIDAPALREIQFNLRERLLYWYLHSSNNPHWEHERSI
jgi:hypothetical protein